MSTERQNPHEVMPATGAAGLDDIGRILLAPPMELSELTVVGNDTTMGRETRTEDIGQKDELVLGANRAHRLGASTNASGGPHQFGMGIADVFFAEATTTKLVDQCSSGHSVIDESGAKRCDGTPRSLIDGLAVQMHCRQVIPPPPATRPNVS